MWATIESTFVPLIISSIAVLNKASNGNPGNMNGESIPIEVSVEFVGKMNEDTRNWDMGEMTPYESVYWKRYIRSVEGEDQTPHTESYDVLEKTKQDIYQKMEYDMKILRDGKEDVVVSYNTNFYTAVAGEKFDDYGSGERN